MICKECGAYNPDHATYCKVCAANLKGEPEAEAAETPVVEDPQPTKRFSRPSWVVPEQAKKPEKVVKEVKEDVKEAEDILDDEEDDSEEPVIVPEPVPTKKARVAKPVVVEEKEEADVDDDDPDSYETKSDRPIWTPTPAAKRAKAKVAVEDDEDDEEEPAEEPEDEPLEEDDSIYNDEEALDQDDDSFEYEPTPPKRKNAKKKNNTVFTVLLIAIIVVIVLILVAGGLLLLNKSGVLKCSGNKATPANNNADPVATSAVEAQTTPEAVPDEKTATLLEYVDENGKDIVAITVLVPAHASMTIDFPHQDDYKAVNDHDVAYPRKVNIPVEIFYPNAPVETSSYTIQPTITITNVDGSSYNVECPSFTKTFPELSITLSSPTIKEDGSIMAAEGNVVHIEGKVAPFDYAQNPQLTVNGIAYNVYDEGVIMLDYNMNGAGPETIDIVATQNNHVTASTTLNVDPYVFVPDPMVLEVKDDIASLKADKSGKLTVTGTTLPGATLSATSDDTTRVLCGTVTVDADGKFSFGITMDSSFYGISTITLNATKEGAEDGSTTFVVSRSYADKDAFIKAYGKKYKEINRHITMSEILADLGTYAGNNYGFRIIGTVNEIITDGDKTYVKMTLAKTNEVVYVRNMSAKWAPQDNIGGKYRIYCNLVGTYQDTGCAEFLGWFVYNSK